MNPTALPEPEPWQTATTFIGGIIGAIGMVVFNHPESFPEFLVAIFSGFIIGAAAAYLLIFFMAFLLIALTLVIPYTLYKYPWPTLGSLMALGCLYLLYRTAHSFYNKRRREQSLSSGTSGMGATEIRTAMGRIQEHRENAATVTSFPNPSHIESTPEPHEYSEESESKQMDYRNDTPEELSQSVRLVVFLCHSSEDKDAVRVLYRRLEEEGMKPWLDEEDIIPGKVWSEEITRAVYESDVVLVCLSKQSVSQKGWNHREIKYALDRYDEMPEGAIFLIPLRLEPCDLPNRLKHIQCVNLYEERGYQRLLKALQEAWSAKSKNPGT